MNDTLNKILLPPQLGGQLGLDFVNTLEYRHKDGELEMMPSYLHLLAFCARNDLLSDEQTERLYAAAQSDLERADSALRDAKNLREMLYAMFAVYLEDQTLQSSDLTPLNEALSQLLPYRRLEIRGDKCVWGWQDDQQLERLMLPILIAAADLLTSESLKQLRQCPNCGWLFLDTSRNHSRRWCSMDFCGSKMKSRRQYERIRKTSPD